MGKEVFQCTICRLYLEAEPARNEWLPGRWREVLGWTVCERCQLGIIEYMGERSDELDPVDQPLRDALSRPNHGYFVDGPPPREPARPHSEHPNPELMWAFAWGGPLIDGHVTPREVRVWKDDAEKGSDG